MVSNWLVIALLLRISDAARQPSYDPGVAEIAAQPVSEHVVPGREDKLIVVGTGGGFT